jgi:hypothetical protein
MTSKLRYITHPTELIPHFAASGLMYGPDGRLTGGAMDASANTRVSRAPSHGLNLDVETQLLHPNCTDRVFYACDDRSRNLDTSGYIPAPSRVSTGFGNIEVMGRMKIGDNTRLNQPELRDVELDRFFPTFRNFQNGDIARMPVPADTRHLNKKFYI